MPEINNTKKPRFSESELTLAGIKAFTQIPPNSVAPEYRTTLIRVAGLLVVSNPTEFSEAPEAAAYAALHLSEYFHILPRGRNQL